MQVDSDFVCWSGSSPRVGGNELLCWNGTTGLTSPNFVYDINPGSRDSHAAPLAVMGPVGNRSVCMSAETNRDIGKEPHCVNLETGLVWLLYDVKSGADDGFPVTPTSSGQLWMVAVDENRLCFVAGTDTMPVSDGDYVHCLDIFNASATLVIDGLPAPRGRPFEPVVVRTKDRSNGGVDDRAAHLCYGVWDRNEGTEVFCMDVVTGNSTIADFDTPGSSSVNPTMITALGEFVCYASRSYGVQCWAPGYNASRPLVASHIASGEHVGEVESEFNMIPTHNPNVACMVGAILQPSDEDALGCIDVAGLNATGGAAGVVPFVMPPPAEGQTGLYETESSGRTVGSDAIAAFGSGMCYSDVAGNGPMCWTGNATQAPFVIADPSSTIPAGGPSDVTGNKAGFAAQNIRVLQHADTALDATHDQPIVWFSNEPRSTYEYGLQDE